MSRGSNITWSVLALIGSFILVFIITFVAGSRPSSRDQLAIDIASAEIGDRELIVTVPGQDPAAEPPTDDPHPIALPILERRGKYICQTADPRRWGWQPADQWMDIDGRTCISARQDQPFQLRFVRE